MTTIKDIAQENPVMWGAIAEKIDENFAELQNELGDINSALESIIDG